MPDDRCRLGSDDVVIGLDLASTEHQVVVLTADGQRLTRFKTPHSRVGLEELLRRTMPAALSRTGGSRVFASRRPGTCGRRWRISSGLGASGTWSSIR